MIIEYKMDVYRGDKLVAHLIQNYRNDEWGLFVKEIGMLNRDFESREEAFAVFCEQLQRAITDKKDQLQNSGVAPRKPIVYSSCLKFH